MPKSRQLIRVLLTVAVVLWAWWSASHGDWLMVRAMVVGAVLGALILSVLAPWMWKRNNLVVLRDDDSRVALWSEFPQFDAAQFDLLSAQWRELGFETCDDRVRGESHPHWGVIFSRLLHNPTENAVVEVLQIALPSRVSPPSCSVSAYYGDSQKLREQAGALRAAQLRNDAPLSAPNSTPSISSAFSISEDDVLVWSLSVSNLPARRGSLAWRSSHLVGERLDPGATPRELWDRFRARREWLETRLQQPRIEADLPQVSRDFVLIWRALMRGRLEGARAIRLFWRVRFRKSASRAFWGELGEPPAL